MSAPWLANYPPGVPATLPGVAYRSLAELMDEAFRRHASLAAFRFMGRNLSFTEIEVQSRCFAAYLQTLGLERGARVALMMPNVPQYPIAVAGVLRAGFVVVNTNPLYTPRELQHQLQDSGARVVVVLENMAATLAACIGATAVEHVIVTRVGDALRFPKGAVVNFAIRHVKRMVPAYDLPTAISWNGALRAGARATFAPPTLQPGDLAVLQYTGGTTGVAKGAMLTHGNIVAAALQAEAWHRPALDLIPEGERPMTVCALPLYHIFGFTVNMMLSMRTGGCNLLIPNPRDIAALLWDLRSVRFHSFPAVNTLFAAIARHPQASRVDWSSLKLSVGGGMAVQASVAERWRKVTGSAICEGYGLSETSPTIACNPVLSDTYTGAIGLPLPSTELRVVDEDGCELPLGQPGELAVRGPQVMAGYWNRPEETRAVMTADGFFRTGDIGLMDERGWFRIVDRKKDMINVSGFNVYPSEIEDVVLRLPGVAEAAVVGVPDAASGEAVKLFLVRGEPGLTEAAVRAHCRANLTNYKRPRAIEFRDELPKSNVGKVLRRALREE
ncbi:AMP-binding protein [Aureimonas leprariae]|uniref:Long-chain-fatty-acid--CoA ligase n=1 Tax=Plantimonas leprariae TaxID=2615207 RepID=A0A7V7PM57_9HYPH|nr:AMP-binding protein [Aureimonas leprariae]KAB0677970.1 AMP-binding protein [Aureimonas leprariae]